MTFGWFEIVVSGALTALVSILIAVFVNRSYKLVFQHYYMPFVSDAHGEARILGINLSKDGSTFARLGRTIVIVWNCGRKAIRHEHDVKAPVTIRFPECARVVHHELIRTSREGNPTGCRIDSLGDHAVVLSFTHLRRHDGAVIYIVHDGRDGRPIVEGELVDTPIEDAGVISRAALSLRVILGQYGLPAVMIAWGVIVHAIYPEQDGILSLTGFGVGQAIAATFLIWDRRRRFPRSLRVPPFS